MNIIGRHAYALASYPPVNIDFQCGRMADSMFDGFVGTVR